MKKNWVTVLMLSVLLLLAGCSKCEHEYGEPNVIVEATCTQKGEQTYTCNLCGKEKRESIPVVNHTFDDGTIEIEPTCTMEGEKTFTCTACGFEKTEKVPVKEHEYERIVIKEPTFDASGTSVLTCINCGYRVEKEVPKMERTIVVSVSNKESVPADYDKRQYLDRVEFSFVVENQLLDDVRGVSGRLYIYDKSNEEIVSFSCDFTGQTIPAGSSVSFNNLGINVNEYVESNVILYDTPYEDLIFEYEISSIIYAENQAGGLTGDFSLSVQPVVITVIEKENLPINYDVYRFSPRVEFSFDVRNTTSKDIKGIEGVLHINDLFGKNIISFNCDFTGKTVPANSTITVSDLGIDINQFMSDHTKLYNEDFEDLNFEYELATIIYSDGTEETF